MATFPLTAGTQHHAPVAAQALWWGVPWFVWAAVLSLFFSAFGLHYDMAWHRSIGRDGFWNPAHVTLYMSGVVSAVYCAYLIAATTWGDDLDLQAHSVGIWGLRAPIGVFVAAWGGLGMLYNAAFDNWWHNSYGLDVRFASPPHLLFSFSMFFEMAGALLLACSYLNRVGASSDQGLAGLRFGAEGLNRERLQWCVLLMGAFMLISLMVPCSSYTWDNKLHSTKAYLSVALVAPVTLAFVARVTRHRWAATIVTAMYMLFLIALIQIFPLFPATPRLGPIYVPVTHFIPTRFPLLLLPAAAGLDLWWQRRSGMGVIDSAIGGLLFTGLMVAAEWPFAKFLLSPVSGNRFFGTRYLGFSDLSNPPGPGTWPFWQPVHGLHLLAGLLATAACAAVGVWAGTAIGDRVRTIRR